MAFLKGWRTHIVSIALFLVGWADLLHGIDIRSFLEGIGIPHATAGTVMIGMAILMAGMRQITSTPPGKGQGG